MEAVPPGIMQHVGSAKEGSSPTALLQVEFLGEAGFEIRIGMQEVC